jgi:HlyD family secretion protein
MQSIIRFSIAAIVLAAMGFGAVKVPGLFGDSRSDSNEAAVYKVRRRTLEDRVIERGIMESQKTVYGKCEIPGRNKITFIVPEGSQVKKGDKVAEFETTEIDKEIKQKKVEVNDAKGKHDEVVQALEIQLNKNKTDIATAELEFTLAQIDLEKYIKGDYASEQAELERAIKEAQAELEKIRDERNSTELLVKKGYRTPQQLLSVDLNVQRWEFQVERDQRKLEVLQQYQRKRMETELRAKAEESERKLERAKKTAEAEQKKAESTVASSANAVKIHEQRLEELEKQRGKCTLLAEQDGTVAYANERWYDAADRIREGTELWSGRNVYYLPDMSRMQVKAQIHESVIDRIKVGQQVAIRLDAFADVQLAGTISSVAGMAASSYSSVQNYETIVKIDKLPEGIAVKPGMTAEVDIHVGTYEDVLAVPVSAITEHFEQTFAYVLDGEKADRRVVKAGRITHSFIEITEGLKEGETVALDAYQRGLADFADAEKKASLEEMPRQPTAKPEPDAK